jgi:hypothetical protein
MENVMKKESNVVAIAAWINVNAKVRPVSVLMEQKGGTASLIGFMNGSKGRRTAVVSFSKEVAKEIGIDADNLMEGYENAAQINIDLFETIGIANRIRLVETTDEAHALENYFRPKTFGADGDQLVTPDGEPIYFKYEWVETRQDGSSDDVTLAYIPQAEMNKIGNLKETAFVPAENKAEVF